MGRNEVHTNPNGQISRWRKF